MSEEKMMYPKMYPEFKIDKEQPLCICGVPFEEVQKVLTIYRETGVSPTKDYAKGFEDGVNKAYEEINKLFTNAVKSDDLLANMAKGYIASLIGGDE